MNQDAPGRVVFETASETDVPAIVELLRDDPLGSDREGDDLAPYLVAFTAITDNPEQLLIVGRLDGTVVATAQLSFLASLSHRGTSRCDLEAVRVASGLRGQGIGTDLCAWIEAAARQRGCGVIQLSSSNSRTDARRFYERLGFASSHTGMKLWLDPH